MRKKKKKGFTLIEVLGVIVIMSIVVLITVPIITGIIDKVRKNAYRESVRSIFDAVDIYLATSGFKNLPEEGVDVIDPKIMLKHKDFISGKIIKNENGELELNRVSNGVFCAGGTYNNIIIVKGSCDKLDVTPPIVAISYSVVKSNLVTLIGIAEDEESGINSYQFSKDNGVTWTEKQENNTYTFTGLTNNVNYSFKVRVYNNNGLMSESEVLVVKTTDIALPTYAVDVAGWSKTKVVTIHYPERQENYIYQYSLDNAVSWIEVEYPLTSKDIVFTENGSIIARILDGTNEINGTLFTVSSIDLINPTVTLALVGNPFTEDGWAKNDFNLSVQALDGESGIAYYKYCNTTNESCVPTEIVNNSTGTATISTEGTTNRVCVKSYDKVGNESEIICSAPYKLDKSLPTVAFEPNSNSTYQKSHSIKVIANDTLSGIKPTSLKYLWSTNPNPSTLDFTEGFTNNTTITTPMGASGTYYLGISATDKAGNTLIQSSGIFNLDNLKPDVSDLIISLSNVTSTSFTINRSGNATDLGGSGLPTNPYIYQISLDKSLWVTKCTNNSTSCNASGLTSGYTYYYRVCVVDNAGNEACTNSNVITPVSGYYCGALTGTAVASDVLSGKTFYNSSGNLVTGSMPNRGAVSQTITSQGGSYTIPAGYHNGSGKVTASFSNLSAGNIKTGVNIGGVTGTFTSDATAVAGNILSGKTAYVNGNKVTGTMTNRGTVNQTITTQGGSYTIPAGYHSGSGKVTANFTNLSAGNIKAGVNVGGVVGTYTGDYSQVTAGDNYVLYDKGKGISCSGAQKERWAMVFHGISGTIRFSFTGITSKTDYVRTYYIKINDDVVKGPLTKDTGSSDDYTWTYDLNINFGDRLSLWGGTTGGQCSISSVTITVTNPPSYYED